MSLLTTGEQHRRHLLRRLLLAAAVLALVVAASVTLTLLVYDEDPEGATGPQPGATAVPTTTPQKAPADAGIWRLRPVSAGPLILPQPASSEQQIPTGFPHTTEGAISAAARYAQTALGLDPDTARVLGGVAGAPSYLEAARDFAQAAASARQSLGLRPGEPTAGAYLTFGAQAYRVSDAMPDRVRLAVLGRVEAAGPVTQGQGRSSYVATSYTLVWAEGDWRIAGDGDPAPSPVPKPRSPQAYQEGWRDLALA